MDEHCGDGSRREMEGTQGSLLPQESPSVLSSWVSPSLNPEAPGKGLVSGELTSGLITGRWAQAARRHSSSITSSPILGFPSSQVCQPPLGGQLPPHSSTRPSPSPPGLRGADCQPGRSLLSLQPFRPRGKLPE